MQTEETPWTVTTTTLFDQLRQRRRDGTDTVVVTVVDVDGSAYRRPGAKMAVTAQGEPIGAVTPGCLEDPIVELAQTVTASGEALVEVFDLTGDDDTWGYGLGCNGVITVLVEPMGPAWGTILDGVEAGDSMTSATVIEGTEEVPVGTKQVFDGDGETRWGRGLEAAADGDGVVDIETESGTISVFVDTVSPPPELLIFGHHGDVNPVARFAHAVGFRVTVASARGGRNEPSSFPSADRVETVRPANLANVIEAPTRTSVVIMSHNYVDDQLALESLLETDVPYIGLMGPRSRFERMRDALHESGVALTDTDRDRISTPVGLDLGGGEPTQVALSIVAEALAVANDRDGGRISRHDGPIHPR